MYRGNVERLECHRSIGAISQDLVQEAVDSFRGWLRLDVGKHSSLGGNMQASYFRLLQVV